MGSLQFGAERAPAHNCRTAKAAAIFCSLVLKGHMLTSAGHEKLLRIFDAERPEAAPQEFPQAGGPIRCVAWTKSDDTLLTSDLDKSGIT